MGISESFDSVCMQMPLKPHTQFGLYATEDISQLNYAEIKLSRNSVFKRVLRANSIRNIHQYI